MSARRPPARWCAPVTLLSLALACCAGCAGDDSSIPVSGERILTGDVVVASAADVVRLAGYMRVTGDVRIESTLARTQLTLEGLQQVDGSLEIVTLAADATAWTLHLPQLARLGQDLRVADLGLTLVLDAPALQRIGGHLDLARGPVDLRLPALQQIHGSLSLHDATIVAIDVPALTDVGGDLRLRGFSFALDAEAGTPTTLSFPLLANLGGDLELRQGVPTAINLPQLENIGGSIELEGLSMALLAPRLRTVGADLRLRALSLIDLDLAALDALGGSLEGRDVNVDGSTTLSLPQLASVGSVIEFERVGGKLQQLVLPRLTSLSGRLQITQNSGLRQLQLPALMIAPSDIIVSDNGQLALELNALRQVGGNLELVRNARINAALPQLQTVVGSLQLRQTVVGALDAPLLASVQRDLLVTDTSWPGQTLTLASLTSVGGTLDLNAARELQTLSLPQLATIGSAPGGISLGDLVLESNPQLQQLELSSLTSVAQQISVQHNPLLDEPTIASSLASVAYGGVLLICDNGGASATSCP